MKLSVSAVLILTFFLCSASGAYKSSSGYSRSGSSHYKTKTSGSHHLAGTAISAKRKASQLHAIPGHGSNVIVKKEDNFFWGMFWAAVLFSDHGKASHITNEIKQEVAIENQELWDEYQQNLETIKSGEGDSTTLKERNKEILAFFGQKAKEKYLAGFSINAKAISSELIEKKEVTGIAGYKDPSFLMRLFGGSNPRGAPIIETRTYERYSKVYQIELDGPKPIKDFKVEAVNPDGMVVEQNASGVFVRDAEAFGSYALTIRFVSKQDPGIAFERSFDAGAEDIALAPLENIGVTDKMNGDMSKAFGANDIGSVMGYLMMVPIFIFLFGMLLGGRTSQSEPPVGAGALGFRWQCLSSKRW